MSDQAIYAAPRLVEDPTDCYFYHTMDLPVIGTVEGLWDLRRNVNAYLGGVGFQKRRVLDIGAASGFLSFSMEAMGAEVVSYDLSENQSWDIVPFSGRSGDEILPRRRKHIRRINDSYWLAHRLLGSQAKKVYGDVYSLPEGIGPVDISVFGSILLHLRDPFLALQRGLWLTRDTVIVTDTLSRSRAIPLANSAIALWSHLFRPTLMFIPDFRKGEPTATWWRLSPEIVQVFLGVLGFEETRVNYHSQPFQGRKLPLFTVVGRRTRPMALAMLGELKTPRRQLALASEEGRNQC